jgi:hypothetical protein
MDGWMDARTTCPLFSPDLLTQKEAMKLAARAACSAPAYQDTTVRQWPGKRARAGSAANALPRPARERAAKRSRNGENKGAERANIFFGLNLCFRQ